MNTMHTRRFAILIQGDRNAAFFNTLMLRNRGKKSLAFDKVNHDKLIQILREQIKHSTTLNLIWKYLKACVMENGLEKATVTGEPQGGQFRSYVLTSIWIRWTKN